MQPGNPPQECGDPPPRHILVLRSGNPPHRGAAGYSGAPARFSWHMLRVRSDGTAPSDSRLLGDFFLCPDQWGAVR